MDERSALTVVAPKTLAELKEISSLIAPGVSVPQALQGKPGDVMAVIMAGAELGLYPMQSLRSIHVIKGRVSMSAEAQVAIVKSSSVCLYFQLIESTPTTCTYETHRKGNPKPTRLTWTIEQAKSAGLMSNDQWRNYPSEMLRARCSKGLVRIEYPDIALGMPEDGEDAPSETRPETAQIPNELVDPPTHKSKGKADTVKVGGHRVEVVDIEFCQTTGEVAPEKPVTSASPATDPVEARVQQPAEQPAPVEVVAPVDPLLVKIEAATTVSGLRAVALESGVIADPVRKAAVSAAYNAKMAALRGDK